MQGNQENQQLPLNGNGSTTRTSGSRAARLLITSLKKKADARRNPYEKMADKMVRTFGNVSFLIINAVYFTLWIFWNTLPLPRGLIFDPYPFGFLTMIVSLEAIILSIFVLMAQNRAAQVSDLREEVDLQIDITTEREMTKALEIVSKIAEKNGIDLSGDKALQQMLKPLNTAKIEQVLERQVNGR